LAENIKLATSNGFVAWAPTVKLTTLYFLGKLQIGPIS